MANVTATATAGVILTPAPATPGSTYHVTAARALLLTPTGGTQLVAQAHGSTGVLVSPRVSRAAWPAYTDAGGQKQSVVLNEAKESRDLKQTGTLTSYQRIFYIEGTNDTTKCLDLGPQVGKYDDLIPTMIVTDRQLKTYARGGGISDMVVLTVNYQRSEVPQSDGGDGQATFTYDFTSESEHVDVAISQTNYPASNPPPAGEALLIGLDGAGDVAGVDIESPILEFTEEHVFPGDTDANHQGFTPGFRANLRHYTARINSAKFREFDAGEVLFVGASAQKRMRFWYVTFRFRVRENVTKTVSIYNKLGAAELIPITKKGWQYLWFGIGDIPYTEAGVQKTRRAPISANVADVYASIDFTVLGIGTQPLT